MMQKTIIGCQTFLLLGVLSVAASSENLIMCAFSRDMSPTIALSKEKYPEYLNLLPCRYFNPLEKNTIEGHSEVKNLPNDEVRENGAAVGSKIMKEAGEKKSEESPNLQRTERFFNDRLAMFARRNPTVDGYKRGPGFRSWGGKRTWIPDDVTQMDKRPRFSSWGGKRSERLSIGDVLEDGQKDTSYRNCDGREDTCDDVAKRDLDNFYDRLLTRDPLAIYRSFLAGSKKYGLRRMQFQS